MKFNFAIPYPINIVASENGGFIAKVGCCTRVYTDKGTLISDLKEYLDDPKKVEKHRNEDLGPVQPAVTGMTEGNPPPVDAPANRR